MIFRPRSRVSIAGSLTPFVVSFGFLALTNGFARALPGLTYHISDSICNELKDERTIFLRFRCHCFLRPATCRTDIVFVSCRRDRLLTSLHLVIFQYCVLLPTWQPPMAFLRTATTNQPCRWPDIFGSGLLVDTSHDQFVCIANISQSTNSGSITSWAFQAIST